VRRSNFAVVVRIELGLVARKPKIAQFHVPVVVDKHILALQVTVIQLSTVEVKERDCDLLSDFDDPRVVEHDLSLVQKVK